MENYIEGQTIPFSIDLAILGTITSLEFRYYKGQVKNTISKFKYPTAEGFLPIVKDGTYYSFVIPKTATKQGTYGIQIEALVGSEVVRAQVQIGTINIKATE